MFKAICFLRGYAVLEICGASPGWALNKLTEARIAFWDIKWVDSLTVQICVFANNVSRACELAAAAMCDCRLLQSRGLGGIFKDLLRRPVLVVMLLLSTASVLILPRFVLFYEVAGNKTIPDSQILREINDLGIGFGVYGPDIYPKWVKDHLVNTIPELQWVTVTQNGCRAQVVVRERVQTPETAQRTGFANVIASQGGMITQQSVFAGQPLYQVGDVVSQGDLLVSGIVDLERTYLIEHARAEIFARTWRNKTVVIPASYQDKTQQVDEKTCIWLVIGRHRIKIFGNSGISYGSCDKMISIKKLELPQGLNLPVRLEIETFRLYEPHRSVQEQKQAGDLLTAYMERTVLQQMRAGQILSQSCSVEAQNGCYVLQASLECHEMIAQTVPAKWSNEEFAND